MSAPATSSATPPEVGFVRSGLTSAVAEDVAHRGQLDATLFDELQDHRGDERLGDAGEPKRRAAPDRVTAASAEPVAAMLAVPSRTISAATPP
jgi:hypothetical protein